MRPASDGNDLAALRAQFDAEVLSADVSVPTDDREHLFAMWLEHLPLRDSLRAASVALEEEPSFIEKPAAFGAGQKPAQAGAGIALPATGRGGAS
jgi:hypothetical protein